MEEEGETSSSSLWEDRLRHADELMKSGLVIASEQILLTLLEDYCGSNSSTGGSRSSIHHWMEPLHRLATLYGIQGKMEESYHLLLCVLHVTPWHVGALDDIMAVCLATGRREEAREVWATRRLPNLVASTSFPPFITTGPVNPERVKWTERAVQQAQEALAHWEHQTQRDFLGRPEAYYDNSHGGSGSSSNSSNNHRNSKTSEEEHQHPSSTTTTSTASSVSYRRARSLYRFITNETFQFLKECSHFLKSSLLNCIQQRLSGDTGNA